MIDWAKKWAKIILTKEIISYFICGLLTTLLCLAVYALCVHYGIGTATSNTIATLIAFVFAYVVNKIFVFQSHDYQLGLLLKEFLKFAWARLFTFVLETVLLVVLVDRLGLWSLGCKAVTNAIVIVLNYILSKKMVFRKERR